MYVYVYIERITLRYVDEFYVEIALRCVYT